MFRQIGIGAAATLVAGVLAIGCSDDGGDTIIGGGVDRPGAFPASQVDENNVSSDARGFTPEGLFVLNGPGTGSGGNFGPTAYWNRSNGTAIMLYQAKDAGNNNPVRLFASYFDGSRFHAPVQIRGNGNGAVEDPNAEVEGVKVLWLETSGDPDADVAAKDGDAIILFTRTDLDLTGSVAGSNEDANRRLWLSYFNQSDALAPATGSVQGGFETAAVALDTDIIATGPDTDVQTFGFVSDSLYTAHEFTFGTDEVDSGEQTTYVNVFYGKDTNAAATPSPRFRFVALDLAAPTLPTAGGTDLAIGASAFDAGEGADIANPVIVYNNMMIWNSNGVGTTSGEDQIASVTLFQETSPGGVGSVTALNEALTTNFDQAQLPDAENVYGEDHGLDLFYIFYVGSGYTDGTNGSRAGNSDAMVMTIPLGSASASIERTEIDAFQNTVDTTVGADLAVPLRSGANGNVSDIQTRIARSGTYILALILGDNTDLSDADQAGPNTVNINDVLFARAVQTRLPATTPSTRTLANSLAPILTAPSLGTATTSAPTDAEADVTEVEFQRDLAHGQTMAQAEDGFSDRGCSFQGNHLRMNFIYQQLNDQNALATADENRLFVNGVTVVLGANDTTAPTAALVSTSEVVAETVDTGFGGLSPMFAVAVDAGDATTSGNPPVSTATAGRVIVYFVSNDNNKLDNTTAGSFAEPRLYAWENGTVTTVSTNPTTSTSDLFVVTDVLGIATVPVNENLSVLNHVGTTNHIWWVEEETRGGHDDLGTRSYNLTQTAGTTAVVLGDRFTPPTSDEPVFIDNRFGGVLLDLSNYTNQPAASEFTVVRSGTTVGVFFDENGRLWYQQTSTDAEGYYASPTGVIRPEIVDNESDRTLAQIWRVHSPNECDNLPRSLVYYDKRPEPNGGFRRGFVRVMR